ncbi:zeta toxin family protein [Rhodococcus sp. NPDC049939]|uniref:zeta toxin family protein n=1 Tax=Rhodococcus sp. NPDC049939 TaxID=3155511 RepID=UPI0033E72B22
MCTSANRDDTASSTATSPNRAASISGQFQAIATAGVPGAGKATSIRDNRLIDEGWRVLDADRVKDYLIREALEAGTYNHILSMRLPDGGTVRPRELATLVHVESTKIVDELQKRCTERGENIIIEGTFSWSGLGERLPKQLGVAGYERFTILDVEVPRERAEEQALHRWWSGRIDTGDELGNRFTPAAVIAALHQDPGSPTICATNVRATFDHPLTKEIHTVELIVDDSTSGKPMRRTFTRTDGKQLLLKKNLGSARVVHQVRPNQARWRRQQASAPNFGPPASGPEEQTDTGYEV